MRREIEAGVNKTAIAIRHVAFEDLGVLHPVLQSAGYLVQYREAGIEELASSTEIKADLLVVLGGPIGACEDDKYPFITDELRLLEHRLKHGLPTLGICLGAQLIARVLGAPVYPLRTKEIGWGPITLTEPGLASPLHHLGGDVRVLHWHGDTFDLPNGASLLASTGACANQAFSFGPNVLGLQFHGEFDGTGMERWLIGHACEIANAPRVRVAQLREETKRYGSRLGRVGRQVFEAWISALAAP